MDIILKSGHIVKDVKCTNGTKSPIGLWVWSTNQVREQILTFDKISVRASEIAAIIEENGFDFKDLPENLFGNEEN